MSNQCCGHGLLNNVPKCELSVFLGLLTATRNMGLFITEPATYLSAFAILATELSVDVYGSAFHPEVAKRAFGEEVEVGSFQVLHLLHMLEALKGLLAEHMLKLRAGEGPCAIRDSETSWPTTRLPHKGLNLLARTIGAIEVHRLPTAVNHAVQWHVIETARTLAHLVGGLRLL